VLQQRKLLLLLLKGSCWPQQVGCHLLQLLILLLADWDSPAAAPAPGMIANYTEMKTAVSLT
jgi:hypothetical protein